MVNVESTEMDFVSLPLVGSMTRAAIADGVMILGPDAFQNPVIVGVPIDGLVRVLFVRV